MPLGLLELISRVGEGNVRIQNLEATMTNATAKRDGGTLVTFYTRETNPGALLNGDGQYLGLVLWLPREVALAVSRSKVAEPPEGADGSRPQA